MNQGKKILLVLAVVVSLGLFGASAAQAQTVTLNLATAPTFVANTGRAEVMGQVTMTGDAICGTNVDASCISTAGTIQILYVGTPIDNGFATGVTVCELFLIVGVPTCNAAGIYLTGVGTVTNTASGGVVSVGVNGGINFAAGDQVTISGVRGRIDLSPGNVVGTPIIGQLTASPSTIAAFVPTSEVVARSADPLTVSVTAATLLQCVRRGRAQLRLTEGFNTAFVDTHNPATGTGTDPGDGTLVTLNPRPLFGGTNNSRINIVLTNLPTGVIITWPAASAVDSGTGATGAFLNFLAQSSTGSTATYVYSTPNQALSDINGEIFNINVDGPVLPVDATAEITLSGTSADFGTSTIQAQMFPPATPPVLTGTIPAPVNVAAPRPRYNHPLERDPGQIFLTVGPCVTNLLFPWVAQLAGPGGVDTGLTIANTSLDVWGTTPQTGGCNLNLFPSAVSAIADAGPIVVPTGTIQPGSNWRSSMSAIPSYVGQLGYIIAVCQFQYGHGFAFITDNYPSSPVAAQGYLALIIPDPIMLAAAGVNRRSAACAADDIVFGVPPYGECLGM